MLFDAGNRKLVATAGKEGILHVVNREDGKLVFKLPMTTVLNHDVPITAEGVRVCPVAGVQWNGPALIRSLDCCTSMRSSGARYSSWSRIRNGWRPFLTRV